MDILTVLAGSVVVGVIGLIGFTIVLWIWQGKINLSKVISESNGDASLSRLQFLIFTLVISLSLFLIVAGSKPLAFPSIPAEILTLLGISGSSYLVSKGIQFSSPAGVARPALLATPSAVTQAMPGAAIPQFTVSPANAPAGTVLPAVTWSLDAPALGTITVNPPNQAVYTPPLLPPAPATLTGAKVTIRAQAQGFEDALIVVTLA
jgi:hypothetical protein